MILPMILPQTRADIEKQIPHAGSMCLLERVIHCDATTICCETNTHLQHDNPLRNTDGLPISAALEYAAQAAAVHGGLLHANSRAPKGGYLAVLTGVQWSVAWLDRVVAPLLVNVKRNIETDGGIDCSFSVSAAGVEVISGSMVIAFVFS